MLYQTVIGILIPFVGTVAGGCCVFFMRGEISESIDRIISAFAGGVMIAAAVFSLIIPAIEYSSPLGTIAFLPAVIGFLIGVASIILSSDFAERQRRKAYLLGKESRLGRRASMILAVTVHNFPEGMAVGVVYAELLKQGTPSSYAGALALSIGIAIQNFPEGAIISMPMRTEGKSKIKAFFIAAISGVVEPVGALLMILASSLFLPALPYVLGFAAGAMVYAVVADLMPEGCCLKGKKTAAIAFCIGFIIMIILDVSLG